MNLFKRGDKVVIAYPDEYNKRMFGHLTTFVVTDSFMISGGEIVYLNGRLHAIWADRLDIIDEDPLGSK